MSRESMDRILESLSDIKVDLTDKPVKILGNIKKIINRNFGVFCKQYFKTIPLDEIFGILRARQIEPIQEDGTVWSGFLTGSKGRATIDLAIYDPDSETLKPVIGSALILTWYKMGSGNWEVIAYLG
jgi:hypothetical protein